MNLDGNQASIREVCDAGLLSGAVTMVWQREKLLQVNEIGYRDIDAGVPMQRDTLFRIASMTKPVTVAAAMSLVDEGKLALRDPITRWAPELCKVAVLDDAAGPLDRTHPARRAILIEDLLTHTSGLAYGFSVSGPISRAYQRLPFGQGPDVWLAALATLPLVHQPGDRVTYSHAIDVLGVIVSRIEDAPLYQVIDERVLGPAGMTDTGCHELRTPLAAAVTHLGSAGVGALAAACDRARKQGTECVLVAPPGSPAHHVLSLVQLPVVGADTEDIFAQE